MVKVSKPSFFICGKQRGAGKVIPGDSLKGWGALPLAHCAHSSIPVSFLNTSASGDAYYSRPCLSD